jgi:hypothetical protein
MNVRDWPMNYGLGPVYHTPPRREASDGNQSRDELIRQQGPEKERDIRRSIHSFHTKPSKSNFIFCYHPQKACLLVARILVLRTTHLLPCHQTNVEISGDLEKEYISSMCLLGVKVTQLREVEHQNTDEMRQQHPFLFQFLEQSRPHRTRERILTG